MFIDATSRSVLPGRADNPPGLRLAAVAGAMYAGGCRILGETPLTQQSLEAGAIWEEGGTPAILLKAWAAGLQHCDELRDEAWAISDSLPGRTRNRRIAGRILIEHWPSLPGDRAWLHWLQETNDVGENACGPLIFGLRAGVLGLTAERALAGACFLELALERVWERGMSLSRERLEREVPNCQLLLPPEFVRRLLSGIEDGDQPAISAL